MAIRKLTTSSIRNNIWYRSVLAGNAPFRPGAGYFAGGGGDGVSASIEKLTFATDTVAGIAAALSSARFDLAGMGNSGVAGYFAGGILANFTTLVSTVNKLDFATDASSTLGTGLSGVRVALAGMANSGTAGYFGGGASNFQLTSTLSTVDKFAFSNDSRTTLATGISARNYPEGISNSGVAGYFGGGQGGAQEGNVTSTVEKLAFSNDSVTTLSTGLSAARGQVAGFENSGTAGYFAGGNEAFAKVTTIDKFAFSSDTRSTLSTGLSEARANATGASLFATAGYVGGGSGSGGAPTRVLDKYSFANDTRSVLTPGLVDRKIGAGSASNSGTL